MNYLGLENVNIVNLASKMFDSMQYKISKVLLTYLYPKFII